MKIFKIIADSKPEHCLYCPVSKERNSYVCGKTETRDIGGGWKETAKYPDERCIFEVANEAD